MSETITRADLERLGWQLSGWTVEQRALDAFLDAVDRYAAAQAPAEGAEGAQEPASGLPEGESLPEAATAPQAPVQRLHLTGTFTIVVTDGSQPVRRAKPRVRAVPELTGPETARQCAKCERVYPIEEFVRDSHGLRGRKRDCRLCENKRKRESRQRRKAAA